MSVQRVLLSRSASGKAIPIQGTTPETATLVHQTLPGDGVIDEIYLKVTNNSTEPVVVTVMWGDDDPEDLFSQTVPPRDGRMDLVQGDCLNNGRSVRIYASRAGVVSVTGHVNRIISEE